MFPIESAHSMTLHCWPMVLQDAPAAMTRQHSQRSLHSMTSGNEATLTYFSHSRPRDPNAALAVQFQESAEAVRLRRLTKQPTGSKLEPSMCIELAVVCQLTVAAVISFIANMAAL